MEWLVPSLVSIGLFLLGQAGALIWVLSAIRNELKNINKALAKGDKRFEGQSGDIDDLKKRVTDLEATCRETHNRRL